MSNNRSRGPDCTLSGRLTSGDREAFRRAAENALASSSTCWGPGSVHRTIVAIWREYLRPPTGRATGWNQGRRTNKLIAHGRARWVETMAYWAATQL
jgi:hypothetical protein